MTALSNGHQPRLADADVFVAHDDSMASALDDQTSDMRRLLAAELDGRDHLEKLLEQSKERERRLTRAIAILDGGTTSSSPKAAASKPTAKPKPKTNENWTVSEETVERVLDAFKRYAVDHPDPFTQTTLATWMGEQGEGIGGETIRRAMTALRDREIVRKCGTTRGGGALWALMPTTHAELEGS
jgi:hypothetical protein